MKRVLYRKCPDGKGVWFKADYHQDWINALKGSVPSVHRAWDNHWKMWWVSKDRIRETLTLCKEHFDALQHRKDMPVPEVSPGHYQGDDLSDIVDDLFANEDQESRWAEDILNRARAKRPRRGGLFDETESERRARLRREQAKHDAARKRREKERKRQDAERRRRRAERRRQEQQRRAQNDFQFRVRGGLAEAYKTLCVQQGAPWEVIKASHKAMARLYHPDHGGDVKKMQDINAAFDLLRKMVGAGN